MLKSHELKLRVRIYNHDTLLVLYRKLRQFSA